MRCEQRSGIIGSILKPPQLQDSARAVESRTLIVMVFELCNVWPIVNDTTPSQ